MDPAPTPLVDTQTLAATGILLALFTAFFWLGFYVGKKSAPPAGAAVTVEEPVPQGQPVRWRVAGV